MSVMSEEDFKRELKFEFTKKTKELALDIIREANTLPDEPASKEQNLDIIKHLIKRLAVHQVRLDDRTKKTKIWLIVLSVIMAIGSVFSVLSFFCRP